MKSLFAYYQKYFFLDNIFSGWERDHLDEGAAGCDAVHGPEPHRGRAARPRHGGRHQRRRDHRCVCVGITVATPKLKN